MESTPTPNTPGPVPPTPSIPRSLLERITGCKVITYLIEGGSKPGDNFMSVLYSVTAEVLPPNKSKKETRHYLLKCFPQHPARQQYFKKINIFHNELQFYTDWVKELVSFQTEVLHNSLQDVITPSYPPCIGGEAINYLIDTEAKSKVCEPTDNFIMMTDLRKCGYKMADKRNGLDLDHMLLVFNELARTHALSWAYQKNKEQDLLQRFPIFKLAFSPEDTQVWNTIVKSNVRMAANVINADSGNRNGLSESIKRYEEKVCEIIDLFLEQKEENEKKLWEMHREPPKDLVKATESEEPWRIICHGDCWTNNLLFKYDEKTGNPDNVVLLDFQISRRGCPSLDWIYLMYSSSHTDFRRAHTETLLQAYHDRFLEVCRVLKTEPFPGFSMDSIKRRYHRAKPLGYMNAVIFYPMTLKDNDELDVNLEEVDQSTSLDDMLIDAFGKGGEGNLYKQRILEVTQELYDEGVI